MSEVDAAAQLARAFLAQHHPNAVAAVVGGSAGAGKAGFRRGDRPPELDPA